MVIYAFGDSITYGSWDVMNSGWAAQMRRYFDQKTEREDDFFALFYNLGIPGETTDGLVQRFKGDVDARERANEEKIFIFAYGANDACLVPSKGKFRVSTDRYYENLRDVLMQAKQYSNKAILLNITPVVDRLTVNPTGKDKSRLNEYIISYNQQLDRLGQELGVDILDIYSRYMLAGHEALFCEDGLHPNEAGHQIIFTAVKQYFEAKKWA